MKHFLFLFLFFVLTNSGFSQRKITWAPQISADYTYTGFSVNPTFAIIKETHVIGTGIKIPVSRGYLPLTNLWGGELYYRYVQDPSRKLTFLFQLSYQLLSSATYAPYANSGKRNYIHEFFPGYGFRWMIGKGIFMGNIMGIGAYYESYYNSGLQERKKFAGLNALFRIYTGIEL